MAGLGEAIVKYLASLSVSERESYSQELTRFARWFGWERPIDSLSPRELEEYTDRFPEMERIEILRSFLNHAWKKKLTRINLAAHLKIKKQSAKQTTSSAQPITLTPEGYEQLKEELKALKEERTRLIKAISQAREDKDFRENAPLHAARERLAQVEPRVKEIEKILGEAEQLFSLENSLIDLGSKVVLKKLDSEELISCRLVYPQEANISEGKISIDSPIGKALLGKRVGEQIEVKVPAGILRYRIEKVQ